MVYTIIYTNNDITKKIYFVGNTDTTKEQLIEKYASSENPDNIFFIKDTIYPDDTIDSINSITKKISVNLSNLFGKIILPEHLYIWTKKNIETNYVIEQFFTTIFIRHLQLDKTILTNYLNTITSHTSFIETIIQDIFESQQVLENITDLITQVQNATSGIYYDLQQKIITHYTNITLGYTYFNNSKDNISFPINPFSNTEYDPRFIDNVFNIKYTKTYTLEYHTKNTELYVYVLHDIISYFENTLGKDNEQFINGLLRIYYPHIRNSSKYMKYISTNSDKLQKYIDFYSQNKTIYNKIDSIPADTTIHNISIKNITLSFNDHSYTRNIDMYNLTKIFNNITLDDNIPFCKIKDPLTNKVIHKIYKPLLKGKTNKYIPKIDKLLLSSWIKGTRVKNIPKFKNRVVPKGIVYEIILGDFPVNNFYEGRIYKNNNNDTYDIIIGSVNICDTNEIMADVHKDLIQSSDIQINKVVRVQHTETIYATTTIHNNGKITYNIDYSTIPNITFDNIKTALYKLNIYLIDKLNNIDFKNNTKYFNIPHATLNNINVVNIDTTMNFTIEDDYGTSVLIKNYDTQIQKLNCLNQYISINEKIYKKNQIVNAFIDQEWVRTWVVKLHTNNTYTLKQIDGTLVDNILPSRIREISDSTITEINLVYKKISDFSKLSPVSFFIEKLTEMKDPEIHTKVKTRFELTDEEYELYLEQYKLRVEREKEEQRNIKDKVKGNSGIFINIDVNHINNIYNIFLSNITSIDEYQHVQTFITKLISVFKDNTFTCGSTIPISDEVFFSSLDEDDEDSDWDIDEDLSDIELSSSEPTPSEQEPEDIPEVITISAGNLIDKLKKINPELFIHKLKGSHYSRSCQPKSRIPLIMNSKEKSNLDNRHSQQNILVNGESCSKNNIHSKCNSILYGNKQPFWYVCPVIIDMELLKPLSVSELTFEPEFKPLSKIIGKKYHVADNQTLQQISTEYSVSVEHLLHLNPSIANTHELLHKKVLVSDYEDWRTHIDGQDIMAFNPKYKNRKASNKHSSLLYITPKGNRYYYPGFINRNNESFPCCFLEPNKKFPMSLTTDVVKTINYRYIMGNSKTLNNNRLGLLDNKLYDLFALPSKCTTGFISDLNQYCLLRKGVNHTENSFIDTYSSIIDTPITSKHIIQHIDEKLFKTLNDGTLEVLFKDRNPLVSSFQNFLEYIASDVPKKHFVLWDLFSKNIDWLGNKPVNMIILEYIKKEYVVYCPKYIDPKQYKTSKIAIVLKNGEHYEPIFLYKQSLNPVFRTFDYDTKIDDTYIIKPIIDNIIQKCSKTSVSHQLNRIIHFTNQPTLEEVLSTIIEPTSQIVDQYNKVIFVLHNNVYTPVYPSKINHLLPITYIDNIDDSIKTKLYTQLINAKYNPEVDDAIVSYSKESFIKYSPTQNITDIIRELEGKEIDVVSIFKNNVILSNGIMISVIINDDFTPSEKIPIKSRYLQQSYIYTFNKLMNIWLLTDGKIKCRPVRNIMKQDKHIHFILTETGFKVPVKPFPIHLVEKYHYCNMFSFILEEENNYEDTKPDERVNEVGNINYYNNKYIKFRYEISQVINKYDINNIINNYSIPIREKYNLIKHIVQEIVNSISVVYTKKIIRKKLTTLQKCINFIYPEQCNLDPHCYWDSSSCKFNIHNEETKNKYIERITNELLRNVRKRYELLNHSVVLNNNDKYIINGNEHIFVDTDIDNNILSKLYSFVVKKFIRENIPIFDYSDIEYIVVSNKCIITSIERNLSYILKCSINTIDRNITYTF